MRKPRVAPAARADLDAIWTIDRTAGTSSRRKPISGHWRRRCWPKPRGLEKNVDDVKAGYVKFPVGSHVIFFRKSESGIDIIRILHQSMDAELYV